MNTPVNCPSAVPRLLTFPYFLIAIALIYIGVYFSLSYTPGNSPAVNPLGWWGWLDQSLYLKAANALYVMNFSSDQYFYPPLYPAVGALFLVWSSGHPYFLVNLLCLLWFAYVFIRLSDQYVPRAVGIFLFFASTIGEVVIFENFVIPWTTNLSVAFLASGILGLVWLQEINKGEHSQVHHWQVALVALSLGLIVPTRPVDALIGMILGGAFVWRYFTIANAPQIRRPHPVSFWALIVAGALVGPGIFVGFNVWVHGAPLGNYLQVASGHGFFIADLPEKLFSFWLNAQPLYGEVGIALVQRFPWLLISIAAIVWIALRGDFLLRTLAFMTTVFYILYLPYGDLLPSGLWRYLNVHYFKWTFALLALFACLLLKQIMLAVKARAAWQLPSAVLLVVPLLLLCIHMRVSIDPLTVSQIRAGEVSMDLPAQPIDFIDLKGLTGTYAQIYFGQHVLQLDGQVLKLYRDFRVLDQESDVRILFIRPIAGRQLVFLPSASLGLHAQQLNAQSGRYYFALALPGLDREQPAPKVLAAYRLNQVLDFSNQGASNFYIGEGFSIPEASGRWTVNQQANINLRMLNGLPEKKAHLVLTYRPLLAAQNQCQRVAILVNGQQIGSEHLCWQATANEAQIYRYDVPGGAIGQDGLLQVTLQTPDAISPSQLRMNADERQLGVFLQTLKITQE